MNVQQFQGELEAFAEVETEVVTPDNIYVNIPNQKENKLLNIFHMNIRSLKKNYDQLNLLLQGTGVSYDLIILSECWRLESPDCFNITGYNAYYSQGNHNQNDGVLIYIRASIVGNFTYSKHTENTFTQINFKYEGYYFVVTAVYRMPSTNMLYFLDELERELSRLNKNNTIYISLPVT